MNRCRQKREDSFDKSNRDKPLRLKFKFKLSSWFQQQVPKQKRLHCTPNCDKQSSNKQTILYLCSNRSSSSTAATTVYRDMIGAYIVNSLGATTSRGLVHVPARLLVHQQARRRHCRGLQTRAQISDHQITIIQPDDWHLHVRDGAGLRSVVPHSAAQFGRAIIMPNLVPPVTTTEAALEYKNEILDAVPRELSGKFLPLMTLYLTDNTTPDDVYQAKEKGIVAFKMYPAGATTNSDSGVTDWRKCIKTLQAMEQVRLFM